MRSFLIAGGTKEERGKKAEEIVKKYSITKFDKIILEKENHKSLGIEQVRRLQHQASLRPYSSAYKIVIIPEAEKLTIPAQNAMLKLIEEPPRNTIIILESPTPEILLPTIVSRCQIVRLPHRAQIEINQEIFNFQFSIFNSILKARVGERIKIADEMAKNREEAIKFCQGQLLIWRKKMLKASIISHQSSIIKIIRQIQKTLAILQANVNPKLALENLLLHYPNSDDIRTIRDRLKYSDDPGSSQV